MICHQEEISFAGLGPCAQAAGRQPAITAMEIAGDPAETRRRLREQCPLDPGVYGMIDGAGELFYVGKARRLQKRVLSYFFSRENDSKAQRIAEQARQVVWERAPHELAALLRELELIRYWLPRMNRRDRPRDRTRGFLCIGRGPAPYAYLAAQPPRGECQVFGPLTINRRLREAVRRLNDSFQLRDCPARTPLVFADQLQLFSADRRAACLRRELDTCLAPCAAACSSAAYHERVRAAVAFLQGTDLSVLQRLEAQMLATAEARHFEQAAIYRDAWQDLQRLHEFLDRLRDGRRNYNFIYPLPGYNRRPAWYLIRHGQLARVIRAPRTPRDAERARNALDEVYTAGKSAADSQPEDLNVLLLLCQWFRRHPQQRQRTIDPDAARQHCRQLPANAAAG